MINKSSDSARELPLVSILLLSMNHERFIEQNILSLTNQTYKNIEVLYLDNISTDNTYQKGTRCLLESGLAFKSFRNEKSGGISKNLNFLASKASGKYICPLSADDWLTHDSIEKKAAYLSAHPDAGMVYNSVYTYYNDSDTVKVVSKKGWRKNGEIFEDILKKNFITGTGCLIRKQSLQKVGFWDEKSKIEDWDMWIRIAEHYRIGFIDIPLSYYRLNTGNNISGNLKYIMDGSDYILKKHARHKNIKYGKRYVQSLESYYLATYEPNFKNLRIILKNTRLNFFYLKQVLKINIGIFKGLLKT